jgi:hypothetical protein
MIEKINKKSHFFVKNLKLLLTIFLFSLWATDLFPQARVIIPDSLEESDAELRELPTRQQLCGCCASCALNDRVGDRDRMILWRIDPRTGDRTMALPDTLLHNFQHTTIPDGFSVAMGHLAPIGSPSLNKIFFDKMVDAQFPFNNAFFPYIRKPTRNLFMNTQIPYAQLTYQRSPFSFGTTAATQEDRFNARFSTNFGKRLNVTTDFELLDARGFYNAQGVRHSNFGMSGNYLSDRFEAHGFFNLGTMSNVESGGLTEEGVAMITHPYRFQNLTPRTISVRFPQANTWNRVGNNQFFFSGRYNFGYQTGVIEADTLQDGHPGHFVPVASITFTSHYTRQFRRFLSHFTDYYTTGGVTMQRIDHFYADRLPFLYREAVDDSIGFTSFRNVVALSLREGFREWVQFGLTGFLEHDLRTFTMRAFENPEERMMHREHAVTLGGVLNRQQGDNLLFNIRADLGVLGANLGEFRALGDIETGIDIAGRRTTLAAEAHLKNLRPSFLQQNLATKFFSWTNRDIEGIRRVDFGDIRRVRVGGRLHIPFINTTFSAGVENIQNFIYFNEYRDIMQESGNVQVLTGRIDQRFRFGIFHWDNHLVYQVSSNDAVIPLPTFALYSNMYLQTMIARVLTLQVGVDTHIHTEYYAPGYEPALLQFFNQRSKQIGNFPISTVYANMHLSQTRFFLMLYNVGSRVFTPIRSFSLPFYPVNPFGLRVGVSVNLNN